MVGYGIHIKMVNLLAARQSPIQLPSTNRTRCRTNFVDRNRPV